MSESNPNIQTTRVATILFAALAGGGCLAGLGSQDGAAETGEVASASSPTQSMLDILKQREGWGDKTTGGKDGSVFHVTNLNDSGSGSLRAGLEGDAARWIVFDVSGTITLDSRIALKSNKTVDASDRNIVIRTAEQEITAFEIIGVENIILINLRFDNNWPNWTEDSELSDAIVIGDSNDIWIHHCHFEEWPDGGIDIGLSGEVVGTRRVSVTWSRFERFYQALRWNGTKLSFGHNVCEDVQRRCIKIAGGRAHSYNNFIKDWENPQIQHAEGDGELYAQRNMFKAGENPDVNRRAEGGKIKLDTNHTFGDVNLIEGADDVDDAFVAASKENANLDTCNDSDCWSDLRDQLTDGDDDHAAAGDSL